MQRRDIGLVLPMGDPFIGGPTARWTDISDLAVAAEAMGFDTADRGRIALAAGRR